MLDKIAFKTGYRKGSLLLITGGSHQCTVKKKCFRRPFDRKWFMNDIVIIVREKCLATEQATKI